LSDIAAHSVLSSRCISSQYISSQSKTYKYYARDLTMGYARRSGIKISDKPQMNTTATTGISDAGAAPVGHQLQHLPIGCQHTSTAPEVHYVPAKAGIFSQLSVCSKHRPNFQNFRDLDQSLSSLRSASRGHLVVPCTQIEFNKCPFTFAGPTAWNSLRDIIRSAESINTFKRLLKSFLFSLAYPGLSFSVTACYTSSLY